MYFVACFFERLEKIVMGLTPEELSEKIKEARAKQTGGMAARKSETKDSGIASQALSAGIELVSAVCVGAFLGYWFDKMFDTSPIGIIVMFFVGFIAGFMNVYRVQMGNSGNKT